MKKLFTLLFLCISHLSFASEVCKNNSTDLMEQLILNHPSIKMAQEMVKGSQESLNSAFWEFFPTPSVEVSARDNNKHTTVARLEQPLWTGGKLTSQYDMAKTKEKENINLSRESAFNILERYFTILEQYTQSKLHIRELKKGLNNLLELSAMLERRIDSGVSSTSDNELLNARIKQIKSDLILAKNRNKIALLQLELLLDRKLDCDLDLKRITIFHSKNIEEGIDRVLLHHPSISVINSQIELAKYELDSTKASVMPTLSLRGEYRRGDLYNEDYDRDTTNQSTVYIAFSANTSAGLSALSNIKAAKIKISELQFKKQVIQKEIIDSFLDDYNNYEVAKNRIKVLESSIISSSNVLNSYKRLFIAGKKQWLNLVDASRELMNYRIQLTNTQSNRDVLAYKLALKNGQIDLFSGALE